MDGHESDNSSLCLSDISGAEQEPYSSSEDDEEQTACLPNDKQMLMIASDKPQDERSQNATIFVDVRLLDAQQQACSSICSSEDLSTGSSSEGSFQILPSPLESNRSNNVGVKLRKALFGCRHASGRKVHLSDISPYRIRSTSLDAVIRNQLAGTVNDNLKIVDNQNDSASVPNLKAVL